MVLKRALKPKQQKSTRVYISELLCTCVRADAIVRLHHNVALVPHRLRGRVADARRQVDCQASRVEALRRALKANTVRACYYHH